MTEWRTKMTVLAIGVGVLMTALAVAIGGLVLEMILAALSRSFRAAGADQTVELASEASVIHLVGSENQIGTMDWAEEAAA
jgi:hypothetical protein